MRALWVVGLTGVCVGRVAAAQPIRLNYDAAQVAALPTRMASSRPVFEASADVDKRLDVEDVRLAAFLGRDEILLLGSLPSRIVRVRLSPVQASIIGRAGDGPGDYRALRDLHVRGDTILYSDYSLIRLTRVLKDGRLLSSRALPGVELRMVTRIAGVADDGAVMLYAAGSITDYSDPNARQTIARVHRYLDGGAATLVKSFPDLRLTPVETRYRGVSRRRSDPVRLAGGALVAFTGNTLATAHGDTFRLDLSNPLGALRHTVTVRMPRRAITPQMRAAAIEREMDLQVDRPRSEPLIDRDETVRQVRTAPYADSLPYLHAVLTSRDGIFWVVLAIAPTDRGWSAIGISARGALVARVQSEFPGEPLAIERDRVLVRETTADGAAVIRVRALAPVAGGRR